MESLITTKRNAGNLKFAHSRFINSDRSALEMNKTTIVLRPSQNKSPEDQPQRFKIFHEA